MSAFYFCANTRPVKTLFYYILFAFFLFSCGQASHSDVSTNAAIVTEPVIPANLSPKEIQNYNKRLSSFFDSTLLRSGFSGGILIAKEGYPVYEHYAGFADFRTKDSMTEHTAIHIASTSKTFTAIAVLQLVQQGKLSLNDSIQKFFPALPYPGVTIKTLLNHRSGIPNYLYFITSKNWERGKQVTNPDVLEKLYNERPPRTSAPDTRFSYCNTNFVLLAMIVEKITGSHFPEYMKEKIFQPLHMNDTYIFTLNDMDHAVKSFNYNNTIWNNDEYEGTYGDKNVYSTPRDLLKWDQALYTEQLVNKALLDSAFTPYSNERPSVHNYGLGFRLYTLPSGKKVIYHFGRWHGFNAAFARLIDEKATVIILGNKFNRNIYNSAHLCYELFGNYSQTDSAEDEGEPESKATIKKKR